MLDLGTLRIGIKADSDSAESKLKSFEKQVESTETTAKDSAQSIESATKSVNEAFGGLATGVKVAGAAIGTAFVATSKSALDTYASYEQNIGGVNKLFGESANQLVADAQEAWLTCGSSANTYMEQVTSFSASLISSLGGDTESAVSYAKTAMVDMADNANTFGTSIEDIQHAYQGFAKQNYTMLDNLKLGYGGTKEEMERLIEDANKVKEANGEMADLSIDSFADITEAIHIMQEEMGIAGTTEKEALTTIEGSVNATKAAWENWLTGLGDSSADLASLTSNLVDSIVNTASLIIPRLKIIAQSIIQEIPNVFSQIYASLPSQIQGVIDIIQGILPTVTGVVAGIVTVVEGIKIADKVKTLVAGVQGLWTVLSANPVLAVVAVLATLAAAFATAYATNEDFRNGVNAVWAEIQPVIQGAIDGIVTAFTTFGETLQTYVTPFLDSLGQTFETLGNTLLPVFTTALNMILPVLQTVGTEFMNFATNVVATVLPAWTSVSDAFNAFVTLVSPLITAALTTIQAAFNAAFPSIQAVVQSVFGIIQSVISTAMGVIQGVMSAVSSAIAGDWSGVWSGIQQVASSIWSGIQGIVSNGINLVRSVISGVLSAIGSLWSSAWSGLVSVVSSIMGQLSSAVSSGISTVLGFFSGLGGRIVSALGNTGGLLVSAGQSIINGLLNGLKSAFSSVQSFVSGIGSWIAEHKGPKAYDLALLIPNGGWIMESLATGLENSLPVIKDVLDETASSIAGYDFGTATVDADFNAYQRVFGKADTASAKTSKSETNITVNNYSPKSLTEKESAREFRKSVRELAFA